MLYYMDAVLRGSSHRTLPGLASHHQDTAQETRQSDDLVQPNHALEITRCHIIEAMLCTKRHFLWAGALILMSDGQLPK